MAYQIELWDILPVPENFLGKTAPKVNTRISKNQRTNDIANKWMMTHNGGRAGLVLRVGLGLGRGARMEEGRTV